MLKNAKNLVVIFLVTVSFIQKINALSKDEAISFVKKKANRLKKVLKEKTVKAVKFAKEHKKALVAATAVAVPTLIGACEVWERNFHASDKSGLQRLTRYSLSFFIGCGIIVGKIIEGAEEKYKKSASLLAKFDDLLEICNGVLGF